MKKIVQFSFSFLFWVSGLTLTAQVSISTDNSDPDASAMLDVKSMSKGILIPRMTDAERDAIAAPANGLMVYVTTDSSFYFYEGNAWAKVGRQGWGLNGNAGTTDGTNFIGTTDDAPLNFQVNNHRLLRLEYNGTSGANIIAGSPYNSVKTGLKGATISGGGGYDFGVELYNNIQQNGNFGTISGGNGNFVLGKYATIPGGFFNQVRSDYSFAAGSGIEIASGHTGATLFSDFDDGFTFNSVAAGEFAARARGGFRFVTAVDNNGNPTKTVSIDNTGTLTAPYFVGDGSGLTGIPDNQTLSLSGSTLSIENGNSVDLGVMGADNLGNHIATQTLDLNNQDISNGDTVTAVAFVGDGSGLTNLPSSNSWGLSGNAGTTVGANFIGTTDNVPLEFKVNNARAMRLEYAEYSSGSPIPNFISGAPSNSVSSGIYGATIAGGGGPSGSTSNEVNGNWGTVVGGIRNKANSAAAVVGGEGNHADGDHSIVLSGYGNGATGTFSTIVGGDTNTASGSHSTAIGGTLNKAGGPHSLAAGYRAQANNSGSFVFADKHDFDFASTQDNEFSVRATGGVRLVTAIDGSGTPTQTVSIDNNGAVTATAFVGDGSGLTGISSTDDQTLSLSGTTLSIENGNSVSLSNVGKDNLGNHIATQTLNLNGHYLSGDGGNEGVFVNSSGQVGINMNNPGAALDINGTVKIQGGTPGSGKVLTSDANGLASWQTLPNTPASSTYYTKNINNTTYPNDDIWQSVTNPVTISSWSPGDVLKLQASATLRLTAGTGVDPFEMRVRLTYGSCGDVYSNAFTFTPGESASDHDNWQLMPFLDMVTLNDCSAGSLTLTLEVQNLGDDAWEASDRILVVTRL